MRQDKQQRPNYFGAAMVGALTALGAVGAFLLSKKENREKVRKTLDELKTEKDKLEQTARQKLAEKADKLAAAAKKATDRAATQTKKSADKANQEVQEKTQQ